MRSRSPANGPLLRSFAAVTLLVWVAALVFCAELCSSSGSAADSESTHCHAEAADAHHGHDDSSSSPSHHAPCGSASCLTLKQALVTSKAAPDFHPPLHLIYNLPSFAVTLDAVETAIQHSFRQAKPRDWVLTPEVCLGPALRSLAPPSLLYA